MAKKKKRKSAGPPPVTGPKRPSTVAAAEEAAAKPQVEKRKPGEPTPPSLRGVLLRAGIIAALFYPYLIYAVGEEPGPALVISILALGLMAPFVLAPYGRHYDFPILLVAVFVLMGRRLSEKASSVLVTALLILPYINLGIISEYRERVPSTVRLFPEFTFLWIPVLVILCWLVTEVRRPRHAVLSDDRERPPSGERFMGSNAVGSGEPIP